jgi:YggT family protein
LGFVCGVLFPLAYIVLIARIALSWVPVTPGTFLAQVNSTLYAITEPVLGPLRRAIPPVRLGAAALDLSPIVVFLGLQVLSSLICS